MSSLREPSAVDAWREFLEGELTVDEAAVLLGEVDVWAVPGLSRRRVGPHHTGFFLVTLDHRPTFEQWLTRFRPGLVAAYEAADALRRLEGMP